MNENFFQIAKMLHKKSCRDESGLFLIEGSREIGLARQNGVEILHIFNKSNTSNKNLERISYRGEIIAVAKSSYKDIQDFQPPVNPLIIILDGLEKPGNIGAVIRTADAAGVAAVITCDGAGDLYNPNLIRASLGAVFSVPVFQAAAADVLVWLHKHKISVIAATPDAQKSYFEADFAADVAIIAGSEAHGISDFWKKNADELVKIPMIGTVNSLNVSVSAAILMYKALERITK